MISTTLILGTDSISASRLVINDNFTIQTNEINLMENYFNPSSGIIDQLNSLTTNSINVGLSSTVLTVTPSVFSILSDVILDGDISISGNVFIDSIRSTTITTDTNIGSPTTAPDKTVYRVTNSTSTLPVVLNLYPGEIGQDIFIVYDQANTGIVSVVAAGSAPIMGATQVNIDSVGSSIHLKCITNSTGNAEWYVVGGNNYTIV